MCYNNLTCAIVDTMCKSNVCIVLRSYHVMLYNVMYVVDIMCKYQHMIGQQKLKLK
jgi:hypothetical protein